MVFATTITKRIKSGTAVILAGNTSVLVNVSMPNSNYAPVLTPETNVACWVSSGKTANAFTINISSAQESDLNIHWIIREN